MTKRMADSITPANLPPGMDAYLGYVDGRWPDYQTIAHNHGDVPVYGLTVFGNPNLGDGTDSEPGNATIGQTVTATKAELARGVDRPIVYCPASWAADMVAAHTRAGVARTVYRLLTAHYGVGQHICRGAECQYGAAQADGTQWIDHGDWDESLLDDSFLAAAPHPGPPPPPPPAPPRKDPPLMLYAVAVNDSTDGKIKKDTQWLLCDFRHSIVDAAAIAAKYGKPVELSGNQIAQWPGLGT